MMEARPSKKQHGETKAGRWRPSRGMTAACTCLAIVLIVGAVFSPVLTAGFIDRDDHHYVYDVGRIWLGTWSEAVATFGRVHMPGGTAGYYQPATALSLMLDARLTTDWASRTFQFHLTNLLLHVLNVALLFLLIRWLSGSTFWAALCALVFGLHPVQVESVAWVSQRMTLLATLFSLLALFCYIRHGLLRRPGWLVPVPIFYAAAILSKPTFIGLPVVFLLMDVWPLRRRNWLPIVEKLPLLVLLLACGTVHYLLLSRVEPGRAGEVNGVELVVRNVTSLGARTVWPAGSSPFRPLVDGAGGSRLGEAAGVIAVALLMAAMVASFRFSRPLFVAIAGAVVLVFPGLRDAPFSDQLLGDHYLYAVLIVPMLAGAAWLRARGDVLLLPSGRCAAMALAAAAIASSVVSFNRTFIWHSNRDLYAHAIEQHPTWAPGYVGLVKAFIQEGELDSALRYAKIAVETDPDDPSTQFYFGRVLLLHGDGRSDEAIGPLRRALRSDPDWVDCLHNLGIAMADTGQVPEAISYLERARDLRPNSPSIRVSLGTAYLDAEWPASARREFQLALKHRNDALTNLGLARAWAANDMPEYARRHLAEAVEQDPRYAVLAARYPELRRLSDEPGFESLIDLSEGPVDAARTDRDGLPPQRTGPGL